MGWILWAHDIYGPDSGRTKEYCNKMFTDLGVTCILPDFFRGQEWPDPIPTWETGLRWDWEFKLLPYLLERGARRVGAVGTCFGSYIVMHTHAEDFGQFMFGGVSLHPGHPMMMDTIGEQNIDAETFFDEYEDPCAHGFFNKGNLTDPVVKECVDTAMDHLQTFIKTYVINN